MKRTHIHSSTEFKWFLASAKRRCTCTSYGLLTWKTAADICKALIIEYLYIYIDLHHKHMQVAPKQRTAFFQNPTQKVPIFGCHTHSISLEPPESPAGNCAKWSVATTTILETLLQSLRNSGQQLLSLCCSGCSIRRHCNWSLRLRRWFFRTGRSFKNWLGRFLARRLFLHTRFAALSPRRRCSHNGHTTFQNCSCARSTWLDSGAGPTRSSSASKGFCWMGCGPAGRSCSGSSVVTGVPLGTGVPEPMAPELPALDWTVSKVTPGVPMFTNPLCPDAAGPQGAA